MTTGSEGAGTVIRSMRPYSFNSFSCPTGRWSAARSSSFRSLDARMTCPHSANELMTSSGGDKSKRGYVGVPLYGFVCLARLRAAEREVGMARLCLAQTLQDKESGGSPVQRGRTFRGPNLAAAIR